MSIDSLVTESDRISVNPDFAKHSHVNGPELYEESQSDRLGFWKRQAQNLDWIQPFDEVLEWDRPYAKWFLNGKLNASANCLDRHLDGPRRHKAALIWEGEQGDIKTVTYAQLHRQVSQLAYQLHHRFKVKKGDRVTLYMPMVIELVVAVLACARVGAIHSVVFGGFSAQSLKDRLIDSDSKLVITADGGFRRGSVVNLKGIVDTALKDNDTSVKDVIVVRYAQNKVEMTANRDVEYDTVIRDDQSHFEPVPMDSEDPLFILYTSGTTGKPKGIVHSTGGYLTHAQYSTKVVFDLKDSDVYWCSADVGWITGHTYLVYGPLLNGATVMMAEGAPDYPDKDRFWSIINRHQVSIFYTAPTAIRAFMKWGDAYPNRHDLSSLRLLGTVGEPINPEAWRWYYDVIGQSRCPVVDTWWQTETGGIMISTLPGYHDQKPGQAGCPLPGIEAAILGNDGEHIKMGGGLLSLTQPWPSMLRGVWGDPDRFNEVYWSRFETYFAGDGAIKDEDGYYKVLGRVDDVLNVAGHRIGTMEVESCLVDFESVAEAAVVGINDEIKGQAIMAYVTLKEGAKQEDDLASQLSAHVAQSIGPIAKPKFIVITPELPKTRSGKIMRRILKNIAEGAESGDTSTLANPDIVRDLEAQVSAMKVPAT